MNYNNTLASIEMTKFERQAYLLKQYNFICDCQACSENWPPVNGPNRRVKNDYYKNNNCRRT